MERKEFVTFMYVVISRVWVQAFLQNSTHQRVMKAFFFSYKMFKKIMCFKCACLGFNLYCLGLSGKNSTARVHCVGFNLYCLGLSG